MKYSTYSPVEGYGGENNLQKFKRDNDLEYNHHKL
jgi:hypothetical protein